jgi:hypothetical protein
MNDQELEKALADHSHPGDAEEAIERGGGEEVARKRKRQRFFAWGIPVLSAALALAVAIPLTWHYAALKKSSDLAGDGANGDPIAYMKLYASHYYPYSIASFIKDDVLYGSLFYSFSDRQNENLTIHLYQTRATAVEVYSPTNDLLCSTQADNIHFAFTGFSVSLTCVFTSLEGTKITMDSMTLDVKPYYDLVLSWQ